MEEERREAEEEKERARQDLTRAMDRAAAELTRELERGRDELHREKERGREEVEREKGKTAQVQKEKAEVALNPKPKTLIRARRLRCRRKRLR